MKDIGTPIEPFVANLLSIILDKCSDKVHPLSLALNLRVSAKALLVVNLQAGQFLRLLVSAVVLLLYLGSVRQA